MLKFSRHTRDRSATMSERSSPENRKPKRQKTSEEDTLEEEDKSSSAVSGEIQNLQKVHAEFEQFLNVVSEDLIEKLEKQKIMKETDKNYYSGVQLFMLTKYKNRIERFRNVAGNNLDNIKNLGNDKENINNEEISDLINRHMEIIGKMKRRSKQILDISDKYAVEDIFDNINLVNECSASLQPAETTNNSAKRMNRKISRSVGVLSAVLRTDIPVEEVDGLDNKNLSSVLRENSSSKPRSGSTGGSRQHSKLSTFLSLTDHLAVLTKTYTGRR